jgi:hypothetical protein
MAKKLRPSATKSSRSKRTTAKQANFLQRLQSIPHFKPIAFFVGFVIVGAITLGWASAATTTYSLWNNSAVPKTITTSSSNERSIELGLRFTPTRTTRTLARTQEAYGTVRDVCSQQLHSQKKHQVAGNPSPLTSQLA